MPFLLILALYIIAKQLVNVEKAINHGATEFKKLQQK